MKKLISLILAILMLTSVHYAEVPILEVGKADAVVQNVDTILSTIQEPIQEYSTEFGVGRLIHTMQKTHQTEIGIKSILPYETDPSMNVVTVESPDTFINGRWLVYPTTVEEAPKNGYWFYLYDQYYHKLGIMAAMKIR